MNGVGFVGEKNLNKSKILAVSINKHTFSKWISKCHTSKAVFEPLSLNFKASEYF